MAEPAVGVAEGCDRVADRSSVSTGEESLEAATLENAGVAGEEPRGGVDVGLRQRRRSYFRSETMHDVQQMNEPTSPESVATWIEQAQRQRDPFEHVRRASDEHRKKHGAGCSVYPTASGPLLTVLAAAIRAERILEVGCGVGYSALCLARASGAIVDTIERDLEHVRLAEAEIERAGYADRIRVIIGQATEILPGLTESYDLVFSDADPEDLPRALDQFTRLLRPVGLLVSANLFLGQFVRDLPGLEQMAQYRQRLLDDERLLTAIVPGGLAVSWLRGVYGGIQ
jgi:predicted O-methyltransferase YrrM